MFIGDMGHLVFVTFYEDLFHTLSSIYIFFELRISFGKECELS